jgi:hypothetical protein
VNDASPLLYLARLVERLEGVQPYVTEAQLMAALSGPDVAAPDPNALLDRAVDERLLFRDARTLHDVQRQTFQDTRVYRVNHRHPLLSLDT